MQASTRRSPLVRIIGAKDNILYHRADYVQIYADATVGSSYNDKLLVLTPP
ncbi:hypothetical protein [Pasteurella multocida]|uniref:hypothetical protein n=1 Tax=Pasteurella multocida TaxID=747 RepID=UPI001D120557|nr:hypothetical protein [Pasteurella multocida]